jgi:uncharacterized protein DUF3237
MEAKSMLELRTEFLCSLEAELNETRALGQTPLGQRYIADVKGGTVTGRVKGRMLPSGGDWLIIGGDGSGRVDVRAAIEADDGSLIYATYNGRLNIPPELTPTLFDREKVEAVDPSRYYFRTAPTFETSSAKYAWLNRIQAIGVGRITRVGVTYSVYEVL